MYLREIFIFINDRIIRPLPKNKGNGDLWLLYNAKSRPFDFRSAKATHLLMRDLKGFTSRKIMKTIQDNPEESRREWMLWTFERAEGKQQC
jgi:hypothetical protein